LSSLLSILSFTTYNNNGLQNLGAFDASGSLCRFSFGSGTRSCTNSFTSYITISCTRCSYNSTPRSNPLSISLCSNPLYFSSPLYCSIHSSSFISSQLTTFSRYPCPLRIHSSKRRFPSISKRRRLEQSHRGWCFDWSRWCVVFVAVDLIIGC
jgi:hypothetical protein